MPRVWSGAKFPVTRSIFWSVLIAATSSSARTSGGWLRFCQGWPESADEEPDAASRASTTTVSVAAATRGRRSANIDLLLLVGQPRHSYTLN